MSDGTKRQLKMHPNLLLDVIGRQAGTLDKACLEGGMNGIEAINALKMNGGTCVEESIRFTYTIDEGKGVLCISDWGKGITTKEEIENFFETFGTPHDESEHKIYAQFRMGRGQMFNFGKNTWRTGSFELVVDVLNNGLEWELRENLPFVDGCHITIELYEKYLNTFPAHTVDCLKDAVKKQMEYVEMPVFFNDEQISFPPEILKWDYEDEFAYYMFNTGDDLRIYNLGVYVCDKWNTQGIVVSKKQLKVNFARNSVMSDCPVMYHINEVIRKNIVKKSTKKYVKQSANERRSMLRDLRNGLTLYSDIKGSRILQTAQDKYITFGMFLKSGQPWTFAPKGSRKADSLIELGSHTVFASEMLYALNYTGEEKDFFDWLLRVAKQSNQVDPNNPYRVRDYYLNGAVDSLAKKKKFYEKFEDISSSSSSDYLTLDHSKLTKVEKRVLEVLKGFSCWDDREIRIGKSSDANAWTDGHSYINIDRRFLKDLNLSWEADITRLFAVLVHELAHTDSTVGTDMHGEIFYETFHDLCLQRWSPLCYAMEFKNKMRSSLRAEQRARESQAEKEKMAALAKKMGKTDKVEV